MPSPARRAAFRILLRIENELSYATELLHGPLTAKLEARDAALATELVLGTLRWQGQLDFLAQQLTQSKWKSLDAEVWVALRLGLYQLRFLRVPARAAVYEAVELVKGAGKRSAAGFVNAVLRRGAEVELATLRPGSMTELEWLAVETSHPAWLLERWEKQFGREKALSLARANNQTPETCIRLVSPGAGHSDGEENQGDEGRLGAGKEEWPEIEARLRGEGIELCPGRFLKSSRIIAKGARVNITHSEACRRGEIVVQDEASQMIPLLLDVRMGDCVLDLCAAPGNKTAQLAQQAAAQGRVIACDLHWHRLREMIAPASGAAVLRVALDGSLPLPFRARFDRILVDAPCSGTGTLRRHPEIKWRLKAGDLEELSDLQGRLLGSAAAVLEEGGRMVYSTCSLEEEENRGVIERFLAAHPEFRCKALREDKDRLEALLLPGAAWILESEFLATFPDRDGMDGFFGAVLEKG